MHLFKKDKRHVITFNSKFLRVKVRTEFRKALTNCEACGADQSYFVQTKDGDTVCTQCGVAATNCHDFRSDMADSVLISGVVRIPTPSLAERRGSNYALLKRAAVTGGMVSSTGRYKVIFHWNERIAQMCLMDPPLPDEVFYRILGKISDPASDTLYGPLESYRRSTVTLLLRRMHLDKYRERWKSVLSFINPTVVENIPSNQLVESLTAMHMEFYRLFMVHKKEMPLSAVRKNGKVVRQERHNSFPFNYECRKHLETMGIYDYHEELPLLRSPHKLLVLDEMARKIYSSMGIPFIPTAIIKRPKIKKRRRKEK